MEKRTSSGKQTCPQGCEAGIFRDTGRLADRCEGVSSRRHERDALVLGNNAVRTDRVAHRTDNCNSIRSDISVAADPTILPMQAMGVPCFTPGAVIATDRGERLVETLRVGDRVFTRDHGFQTIRWVGRCRVPARGAVAPIRIKPGVLTGQFESLLVSPQHRMLFTGYRAELLFGQSEVLVAAEHLVDDLDVTREEGGAVKYLHLLFDTHEIIYANGAATESFHPGDRVLSALDSKVRDALFSIFPHLRADPSHYGPPARRCLKQFETQMLQMHSG